jgi:hypothetical protein
MDSHSRTLRLLVVLSGSGLWVGLTLGAGELLTAAVVMPVARLIQAVQAIPQHWIWGAAAVLGASVGFVALRRSASTRPSPPDSQPRPPRSPREVLVDAIRAAETSPTAQKEMAARLARVAALLRAPPEVLSPPTGDLSYCIYLTQALDALEQHAEGRNR